MKQKKKSLSILFLLSFWTIVVHAQEIINLNNGGRIIPAKGAKSLMVDSPTISFIDTVAVVLEYPTIASISYDNGLGFNDYLILNHLENVVNPNNYDFILMFSINEVPGGINSGWKFDISPKNIGIPKYWIASQRGIGYFKKLRSIPQMNSVNFLQDIGYFENWGSTARTFHEIGHNWGVYYHSDQDTSMNYRTWTNQYPLAYLAISCGGHWSYNWNDKIGIGNSPGIIAGAPVSNLFNAIDLYNMGLMDYEEVKSYQYTIYDYSNNSYKINIDSFRYALSLRGEDFYEGDGKRIPSIDNEVKNLRSLIIIIKGKDEGFTTDQKNLVIKLAKDIPPDWNIATWGRSKMSVGIDNHLLGQTSILNPINKTLDIQNPVQFNWAAVIGATAYDLQIALDSLFVNMVKDTIIANIQTTISLSDETTYFTRVRAEDGKNNGASSNIITFKTGSTLLNTIPTLSTSAISEITSTTATSGGNVTDDGGASVTERGVYWSTSQNPESTGTKLQIGSGTGTFSATLSGLTPSRTYYVKAYATNSAGPAYGTQVSFTTLTAINNPPSMSSNPSPANGAIGVLTALTLSWFCSDPDVDDALKYDIYFGTTSNPTTTIATDQIVTSIARSGLINNTLYYWKIVAKDSKGATTLGPVWSFTTAVTPTIPTVTTTAVSGITQTTGESGGNVTSSGSTDVIVRGVCWSTSSNPTTTDNVTTDGSGTGSFTSNITGLTAGTIYHVRAYATNSLGTGYGEDITFTFLLTGIHEKIEPKILIYPNPAKEFLTIDLEMFESKNLTFEIIDPKGTLVYKESITSIPNNFKKNFNVSDKKPGTYIVKIVIDNALYIQKVIIE